MEAQAWTRKACIKHTHSRPENPHTSKQILKKISYNRQGPRYSNGLKQTAVILNRQLPLITKIPHPYIIENTQPYMVEKEKHTCIHPHKWQTYDDINMRVGNHLGRIKRKQKAS
jgi:hypothetical protein